MATFIYKPKGKAAEYGKYALNIYTGCPHNCSFCVDGNTPILMANGENKYIKDVNIGDEIFGVVKTEKGYKLKKSIVLNKFTNIKEAYEIRLADGTVLISSGDHRWLTKHRGWKYVTGAMSGNNQRPYLTTTNALVGFGQIIGNMVPVETELYKRGYLSGLIKGDGTIGHYAYPSKNRKNEINFFRLAMNDVEAIDRANNYLNAFGINTIRFHFKSKGKYIPAIRTAKKDLVQKIEELITFCDELEFMRGFLAGFYDAEGSKHSNKRFFNSDIELLNFTQTCLKALNIPYVYEPYNQGNNKNVKIIRISSGRPMEIRFRQLVNPAILSKFDFENILLKSKIDTKVESIKPLGNKRLMYDITTTTENFIANGVVAHNCFSPSVLRKVKEEFHNNVLIRPNIIEGVREQLKQNGMKGELIHLCFVCDPYPHGHDSSITRELIKIIKESGNHVQILTKNGADAMRDFDLLDENDWFGISYSGYTRTEYYNGATCEPGASTPYMRVKALEYAKECGINTWVSCEPVMNDSDILEFIEKTNFVDKWKVGKLNYYPSDINWKEFGIKVEKLLENKSLHTGCEYYIKESLREEMKN